MPIDGCGDLIRRREGGLAEDRGEVCRGSGGLLWTIRTPQRAKGGIRAATWDLNQPVAAQAMGLLTAAETLISLDSLAEKARKP
ncbi:MAG: hypothetical protein SYC29_12105 [Planctomycetota bacterium]|nr:hypothetical protein [Planctomycetota bacterium]